MLDSLRAYRAGQGNPTTRRAHDIRFSDRLPHRQPRPRIGALRRSATIVPLRPFRRHRFHDQPASARCCRAATFHADEALLAQFVPVCGHRRREESVKVANRGLGRRFRTCRAMPQQPLA
jgi:hypothetical protein